MIIGKTRTNQPVEGGQEFEDALLNSETSLENIVDADGHKRFVEGVGEALEQEGITIKYNRWSLSGTHLMCVLALEIADTTAIADNTTLVEYTFPEWVRTKIIGIQANLLEYKSSIAVNDSWSRTDFNYYADKTTNGLHLVKNGTYTASGKVSVRLSLDLLIDNE